MSFAIVASIVGIGAGGLSIYKGLQGSGSPGGQGGQTYVPTNQGGADQGWQDFMKQMQQYMQQSGGQFNPAIMSAFQQMMSQQPSMQAAGNVAGDQSLANSNLAQLYQTIMQGKAGQAGQAQDKMYGAGDAVWQTALDPQKELYGRTLQQVQDQSRTAGNVRGLGMSGIGAGLENDATKNFNIDWQNQQLQRQLSGLQGMGGAYGQAANQGNLQGRDLSASMDFSAMAPQFEWMSQMYPMMAAGMPINAANQAGGAMNNNVYGPMGNFMNQMLAYMGMGQGASGQAFGQNQTNLNNQTSALNQIPGFMNQLSSLFGPSAQNPTQFPTGGQDYVPWTGSA